LTPQQHDEVFARFPNGSARISAWRIVKPIRIGVEVFEKLVSLIEKGQTNLNS
jgi:hypothetical protein